MTNYDAVLALTVCLLDVLLATDDRDEVRACASAVQLDRQRCPTSVVFLVQFFSQLCGSLILFFVYNTLLSGF